MKHKTSLRPDPSYLLAPKARLDLNVWISP